jgi:hypothetical protein
MFEKFDLFNKKTQHSNSFSDSKSNDLILPEGKHLNVLHVLRKNSTFSDPYTSTKH